MTTSKLPLLYILLNSKIFVFNISILFSNKFNFTLLFAISATSGWISTPTNFVFFVFPYKRIGIIPVPVPKSITFEFCFIFFAKSVNKILSIPKQKPSLFCIIFKFLNSKSSILSFSFNLISIISPLILFFHIIYY